MRSSERCRMRPGGSPVGHRVVGTRRDPAFTAETTLNSVSAAVILLETSEKFLLGSRLVAFCCTTQYLKDSLISKVERKWTIPLYFTDTLES